MLHVCCWFGWGVKICLLPWDVRNMQNSRHFSEYELRVIYFLAIICCQFVSDWLCSRCLCFLALPNSDNVLHLYLLDEGSHSICVYFFSNSVWSAVASLACPIVIHLAINTVTMFAETLCSTLWIWRTLTMAVNDMLTWETKRTTKS